MNKWLVPLVFMLLFVGFFAWVGYAAFVRNRNEREIVEMMRAADRALAGSDLEKRNP
jgi:hypothetical protein